MPPCSYFSIYNSNAASPIIETDIFFTSDIVTLVLCTHSRYAELVCAHTQYARACAYSYAVRRGLLIVRVLRTAIRMIHAIRSVLVRGMAV